MIGALKVNLFVLDSFEGTGYTLVELPPFFTRETTFMTSCLPSVLLKKGPFQKIRICSPWEHILSFWSRLLFRRGENNLESYLPLLERVSIPLKLGLPALNSDISIVAKRMYVKHQTQNSKQCSFR